ncbi:diacylglycerol kinase, putative [Babesia caballi]|uniref:Diacylglycerol kinase n=1 Tax=Babesia caballi TaxID=5871 RepID=A0AAV4LMS3_BABCB|nr:diacylglycerol kinase, putative [Babesia caballi]
MLVVSLLLVSIASIGLTLWSDVRLCDNRSQILPLLSEVVTAPCTPSDEFDNRTVYIDCQLDTRYTFYTPKEFSSNIYSYSGAFFDTRVEMYQWVERTGLLGVSKVGEFVDHAVVDYSLVDTLFSQARNPGFFPHVPGAGRKFAPKLKLGGYSVPAGAFVAVRGVKQLPLIDDKWYQPSALTYPLPVPHVDHVNTQVYENALYTGDPLNPKRNWAPEINHVSGGCFARTDFVQGRKCDPHRGKWRLTPGTRNRLLQPTREHAGHLLAVADHVGVLGRGDAVPLLLQHQSTQEQDDTAAVQLVGQRGGAVPAGNGDMDPIQLLDILRAGPARMRALLHGGLDMPNVDEIHFSKPVPAVVRFFSIDDGERGNKPGLLHLRSLMETKAPEDRIKAVICGGDGSVMWLISEMEAHHIDYSELVFAIVPYGTGNDFARSVNWNDFNGIMPFDVNMGQLRRVMERLFNAAEVNHDFWQVVLTVEPEGSFNKINSRTRKKETVLDASGNDTQRMEFMMGNYFSFGVDGRIGRGFDRMRSNSGPVNKLIYAWQGMKNSLRRSVRVDKQVDKMLCGDTYGKTVFTTEVGNTESPLLRRSIALIALNIPSYCAGIDAFTRATRVGLENMPEDELRELSHLSQKMGDHRLEFLSYSHVPHIAIDFCGIGLARRVHAGAGPWKFVFKQLHPSEKVYFQVDGEFFVMLQPKEVEIRHSKTIRILK